jgi:hypothetical protein
MAIPLMPRPLSANQRRFSSQSGSASTHASATNEWTAAPIASGWEALGKLMRQLGTDAQA